MPSPRETARTLLENLVQVRVMEKHVGPQGEECYFFTTPMSPSSDLEGMVENRLLERRTSPSGQQGYCLTAPLSPQHRDRTGRERP
jgi:hypothetical protein